MVELQDIIPSGSSILSWFGGSFSVITVILIGLLISIVFGFIIYFIILSRKFKYKIEVWERVGNYWEKTLVDKAMEIAYGRSGDTVFITKKTKKYLPKPTIQTGKRLYWYAIREDGEWINIGMEDIDLNMRRVRARFLHSEMRYARTSLQKGMKERYDKPKFMEKYGHIIIPFAAFALIAIFMWLFADKMISTAGLLNQGLEKAELVFDKASQVVSALERTCVNVVR